LNEGENNQCDSIRSPLARDILKDFILEEYRDVMPNFNVNLLPPDAIDRYFDTVLAPGLIELEQQRDTLYGAMREYYGEEPGDTVLSLLCETNCGVAARGMIRDALQETDNFDVYSNNFNRIWYYYLVMDMYQIAERDHGLDMARMCQSVANFNFAPQ
jgi:hypothetical protein